MAKANAILSAAEIEELEARRRCAVAVVAQQRAIKAVKRQLQARGLKPAHFSRREITVLAKEYLRDHPSIRAELIAEAREIVDQWQAEGFFGKRAAAQVIRNRVEQRAEIDNEIREGSTSLSSIQ
jgi:hypothetical protein